MKKIFILALALLSLAVSLVGACASTKVQIINPPWTDTQRVITFDAQGRVINMQITSVPVTPKDSFWHWLFDTAVDITKKQAGL